MNAVTSSSEPAGAVSTVSVTGHVKWFDVTKGYGFVVPAFEDAENTTIEGDIMLHVSALRAFGESYVDEGARIICEAREGRRGWQVDRIVEMDRPKAVLAQEEGQPREPETVVVKWFNSTKGFGFVNRPNNDADIFIHISVLRRGGISVVETGTILHATIESGPKGDHVTVAYRKEDGAG